MTFGYLGYIWAMLGCAIFSIVVGGSAVFLYAVARRARGGADEPTHTVDSLPVRPRDPQGPGKSEDAA